MLTGVVPRICPVVLVMVLHTTQDCFARVEVAVGRGDVGRAAGTQGFLAASFRNKTTAAVIVFLNAMSG